MSTMTTRKIFSSLYFWPLLLTSPVMTIPFMLIQMQWLSLSKNSVGFFFTLREWCNTEKKQDNGRIVSLCLSDAGIHVGVYTFHRRKKWHSKQQHNVRVCLTWSIVTSSLKLSIIGASYISRVPNEYAGSPCRRKSLIQTKPVQLSLRYKVSC